jgi:two-component system phosphate regulon sensor histidine kinase PhoR
MVVSSRDNTCPTLRERLCDEDRALSDRGHESQAGERTVPSQAETAATAPLAAAAGTPRPRTAKDFYTSRIRLAVVLILCFVVLPGALMLTVGILVLVFGHQVHDTVFGVLILSLAATLIAGITFTFLYVRQATSLARLQTEFVQRVSHDLRTPLTSIRMFVETLRGGRLTDPAKVQECLDVLTEETGRLSGLVERLLKWAKMEAGKRIYQTRHARPEAVIDAALRALDSQVQLLRLDGVVEIERAVAAELPYVDVDVDAMSEALINLLQNALKYTGAEKRIRVEARAGEKTVEIIVADNGPGIAIDHQRRIFEKFYRVVDPADPNIAGTGLGLAMVHHIVGAHAGRITVESEVGRGARFHIFLPAVALASANMKGAR